MTRIAVALFILLLAVSGAIGVEKKEKQDDKTRIFNAASDDACEAAVARANEDLVIDHPEKAFGHSNFHVGIG